MRFEIWDLRIRPLWESIGAAHFIDRMSFKVCSSVPFSLSSNTHGYRVPRNSKRSTSSQLSRKSSGTLFRHVENIMYQCTLFKHDLPTLFPVLKSMVSSPLFLETEMQETREALAFEASERVRKWDETLPDTLHTVAFSSKDMGRSIFCPEESPITSATLHR